MQFADYYRVLGIEPGADQHAIKSAYRRLARQNHPDVAKVENAAKRFLLIQKAFEVLSDPKKRQQYDRLTSKRNIRPQPTPPQAGTGSSFVARSS